MLTKKQKEMLKAVNKELSDIYNEEWDSFNAYVLCCLECIKNYDELEQDAIKYVRYLNRNNY